MIYKNLRLKQKPDLERVEAVKGVEVSLAAVSDIPNDYHWFSIYIGTLASHYSRIEFYNNNFGEFLDRCAKNFKTNFKDREFNTEWRSNIDHRYQLENFKVELSLALKGICGPGEERLYRKILNAKNWKELKIAVIPFLAMRPRSNARALSP